uniref:Uncharacterized protein n=1 Tax=Anguilla anguilla TaxID=7936 RepID=A0A0E9PJA0_ANGAN
MRTNILMEINCCGLWSRGGHSKPLLHFKLRERTLSFQKCHAHCLML